MDFTGKVVIVTGASSGIGAGTAKLLGSLGATLVIVGRNATRLSETAEGTQLPSGIPKPLQIIADVTNEAETVSIVEKTIAAFGRIDVLVNGAGIIKNGSIETTTLQQYDEVMNANVRSLYHLTMLAVPHLIKTKGNIVNISSVTGLRAFPGVLAYNISKSALDQFTRCVALELAPKGVRVNSVNPGVIVTELHKRGGMDEETYAKFLEHSKATHALGHPGEVKNVAAAIAFLASDLSGFTTAVQLPVDGGRHAMCPR